MGNELPKGYTFFKLRMISSFYFFNVLLRRIKGDNLKDTKAKELLNKMVADNILTRVGAGRSTHYTLTTGKHNNHEVKE